MANAADNDYVELEGEFDIQPLVKSLRQEVDPFETIVLISELVDNALQATMPHEGFPGRAKPTITIKYTEDTSTGATELLVEDNGVGMSREQLQNCLRLSYTTSKVPQASRGPGPLPISSFFNPSLNRYGRGFVSIWGLCDEAIVESYKKPQGGEDPRSYQVAFDYAEAQRTQSYKCTMKYKEYGVIDDEDLEDEGWTQIRMRRVLGSRRADLEDPTALIQQLTDIYYFFIWGFPEELWEDLPAELTRGCKRPEGGLTIKVLSIRDGQLLPCSRTLSRETDLRCAARDLFEEYTALRQASRTLPDGRRELQPCVTLMRYAPPRYDSSGNPIAASGPTASATTGSGSGSGSRSVKGEPAVGAGTGQGVEAASVQDTPCDYILIWLYYHFRDSKRSKPRRGDNKELYTHAVWSGKFMPKSKLNDTFPEVLNAAYEMAMSSQELQAHACKLRDAQRLALLLLVSPDAQAHQHKSDFEGRAYKMLASAGPPGNPYVPSAPEKQARLYTYATREAAEAAAGGGSGSGSGSGAAASAAKSRRQGGCRASLSGAQAGIAPGWREDAERGWAALDVLRAHHTWHTLDDDGRILHDGPEQFAELRNLSKLISTRRVRGPGGQEVEVEAPVEWGFDPETRGVVEYGTRYQYSQRLDPLEAWEQVLQADPKKGWGLRQQGEGEGGEEGEDGAGGSKKAGGKGGGSGSGPRGGVRARDVLTMRLVYRTGSGAAKEHYLLVTPWRPSWVPTALLLSKNTSEIARWGDTELRARRKMQDDIVAGWEATLPHRLALQDKMPDRYDINHGFDQVVVLLAARPAQAGEPPANGGGGRGGGRGGRGAGRGGGAAGPSNAAATTTTTRATSNADPSVIPARFKYHFPDYKVQVSLRICHRAHPDDDWQPACGVLTGQEVNKDGARVSITGFAEHIRSPGEYEMCFEAAEEAHDLLDPEQPLTYRFTVTSSQPAALTAYFAKDPAQGAVPLEPLATVRDCRMGFTLPPLVVCLLDANSNRVAFSPELEALILETFSVNPAKSAPKTGAKSALSIRCAFQTRIRTRPGLRLDQRLPQGEHVRFSPDRLTCWVQGLYVKALGLMQTGKGNITHAPLRFDVTLATTRAALEAMPAIGAAAAPAAAAAAASAAGGGAGAGAAPQLLSFVTARPGSGAPVLAGPPEVTLLSGTAAVITVEQGNWLNSRHRDKPLELSKGAEMDNNLVVRLCDSEGNPYYPGSARSQPQPRVQLSCAFEAGPSGQEAGARVRAPLLLRRRTNAAPAEAANGSGAAEASPGGTAAGASGGGGGSGGAQSDWVLESQVYPFDSSGNQLVIPSSELRAMGLPGDLGRFTLRLLLPPGEEPPGKGAKGGAAAAATAATAGGAAGGSGGAVGPGAQVLEETDTVKQGYVGIRKVLLGVEPDEAASGLAGDWLLDGTLRQRLWRQKEGLRPASRDALTWSELEAFVDEEEDEEAEEDEGSQRTLLQLAFERRVEHTCQGPRELFIRPSGAVLRDREAVLAAAWEALDSGRAPLYEQCLRVKPGQRVLSALSLTLSCADEKDDKVDEFLKADVRVVVGEGAAARTLPRLHFQAGRLELPDLSLRDSDFVGPSRTACIRVLEDPGAGARGAAAGARGGAAAAAGVRRAGGGAGGAGAGGVAGAVAGAGRAVPFCYGNFYVREEPYPTEIRLAPVACDLLTGRAAAARVPRPPVGAAAAAAGAAAASPRVQVVPVQGALCLPEPPAQGSEQDAAGSGEGAGPHLLQLRPPGGGGAPVDASALLAAGGLALIEEAVTARAGTTVRVPLVCVDALGLPLRPSRSMAALLAAHTTAALTPAPEEAAALAAAGGDPIPCEVVAWEWPRGCEPLQRGKRKRAAGSGQAAGQEPPRCRRRGPEPGEAAGEGGAGGSKAGDRRRRQSEAATEVRPEAMEAEGAGAEAPAAGEAAEQAPVETAAAAAGVDGDTTMAEPGTATAEPGPAEAEAGEEAPADGAEEVEEEEEEEVEDGAAQEPAAGLPVIWAKVRLPQTQPCAAALRLAFSPPTPAAEDVAGDTGPQPPSLALSLPVRMAAGTMAGQGGYHLTVVSPMGVQAQLCSEPPARPEGAAALLPAPPGPASLLALDVAEGATLQLQLELQDADEYRVGDSGAYRLTCQSSPQEVPREYPLEVVAGLIDLPPFDLIIGDADTWAHGPLLLLLEPDCPAFAHAEPLCLYVSVRKGRYPVEPLHLLRLGAVEAPAAPPRLVRTLGPQPHPRRAAGGPLPGFTLRVDSADGVAWAVEELGPVKLRWERQVTLAGGGQQVWIKAAVEPPPPALPACEGGVFECPGGGWDGTAETRGAHSEYEDEEEEEGEEGGGEGAGAGRGVVPPTVASVWRLVASFQDARIPGADHRLTPLPLVELDLRPGPPAALRLDPACASAPELTRERVRVVAAAPDAAAAGGAAEAGPVLVPELHGRILDRWSNPTPPVPGRDRLQLTATRVPAPAPGGAAAGGAEVPLVLATHTLAPDGSFRLPAHSLAAAGLAAGCDYRLHLSLVGAEAEGAGADGGGGGGDAELLATVYVSTAAGGSAELRREVEGLRGQLEERRSLITTAQRSASEATENLTVKSNRVAAARSALQGVGVAPQDAASLAAWLDAAEVLRQRLASHADALINSLPFENPGYLPWPPAPPVPPGQIPRHPPAAGLLHPGTQHANTLQRFTFLAEACRLVPGAIGPLSMLGWVERTEVSAALAALDSMDRVFMVGRQAQAALVDRLHNMQPGVADTNLANPELYRDQFVLDRQEVDTSHPQLPLRMSRRRRDFRDVLVFDPATPEEVQIARNQGFVGFAVNLVNLPPHHLNMPVQLPPGNGARDPQPLQASLRQTALAYSFGDAMVFETSAHLNAFLERCRATGVPVGRTRLIAADGRGSYNMGRKGSGFLGQRSRPPVQFGGLPFPWVTPLQPPQPQEGRPPQEARPTWGALDLQLKLRQLDALFMQSRADGIGAAAAQLREAAQAADQQRHAEAAACAAAEAAQAQHEPEAVRLQRRLDELGQELGRLMERERAAEAEHAQQQRVQQAQQAQQAQQGQGQPAGQGQGQAQGPGGAAARRGFGQRRSMEVTAEDMGGVAGSPDGAGGSEGARRRPPTRSVGLSPGSGPGGKDARGRGRR